MKKSAKSLNSSLKSDEDRQLILQAILVAVPFDGWTDAAFERGAKAAGFLPAGAQILFPQGIRDVIELFGAKADEAMHERIAMQPGFSRLRVREKITFAVRARLEFLQPHREAVRRMMLWYALPFHLPLAMKRLYQTVDLMWRSSGDASTDFNFYTKRALLAGVLKTTILFWLDDETPDCHATWEFLDRRIADVMKAGKTISLMKEWKPAEIVEMVRDKLKRA
jgi:ubiquinone biosynthesis protein COQ9